jgi:MinD-like ATPase involved in chromosome partitioning or flagellar assembly
MFKTQFIINYETGLFRDSQDFLSLALLDFFIIVTIPEHRAIYTAINDKK